MSRIATQHHFNEPNTLFDTAIEWVLGALLVFSPLAFGATQAWSQEFLLAGVALLCVCLMLKWLTDSTSRFVWTPAYLFIAAFLLLSVLQLLPLPASITSVISPSTTQGKAALLSGLDGIAASSVEGTLSFYPYATWQQIRLVLAVVAVFVVVIHVYRDSARIQRLLLTITCAGLAVGSVAAYQNVTGDLTIYGTVPVGHPRSGPFMNYSHFGQFMNLSVGAAIALLLVQSAKLFRGSNDLNDVIQAWRTNRPTSLSLAALLCIVGPILVCLSMTRMGIISFLIAAVICGALLSLRGNRHGIGKGSLIAVLGLVAFAALLYGGFDMVYSRVATVQKFDTVAGARLQILKDSWNAFKVFPIFGSGLGTYEFVYPLFDRLNVAAIATHAENEYAQLLTECGAIGLSLAIGFIALVLVSFGRAVWRPVRSLDHAAFGLGLGFLAILIHSGSDFGQHVPAIAILTAVTCALLLNLASLARKKEKRALDLIAPVRWRYAKLASICVLFVVVAVPVLSAADTARQAEDAWTTTAQNAADLDAIKWKGSPEDFQELLYNATTASSLEPSNATYRYWLNVYRWRAISQNVDPATNEFEITPEIVDFSKQIVADLEQARLSCPSFGPPLSVIGQLKTFVLNDSSGVNDIRRAYQLTPYDVTVCMIVGALEAQQKRWPESFEAYQRYVRFGGSAQFAIDAFVRGEQSPMAYAIAQGHRDRLRYLAQQLNRAAIEPALAKQCQDEADAALMELANRADPDPAILVELADLNRRSGQHKLAVQQLRRALEMDYGRVDWRIQLAGSLAELREFDQATRELQLCLRQRPKMPEAESLLVRYSAMASAAAARGQDKTPNDGAAAVNPSPP